MSTPVLTYYDLSPDVIAFSTTRHGGVSDGRHGELNINPYCGDTPVAVAANRKALADELDLPDEAIILPHQVHGVTCRAITPTFLSMPPEIRHNQLEGIDSLVTDMPGVCIGVSTADCIPVLLYDRARHAAAAIHAGWRGTVRRIAKATVNTMIRLYGSRPTDIVAVIGPGISLTNFEVGQEVYDQFSDSGFDMQSIARRFPCRKATTASKAPADNKQQLSKLKPLAEEPQFSNLNSKAEKWHIDLPLCNAIQLVEAGVPHSGIIMSGICTYDRVADYFSARRLGQDSGRIYTGIIIKT